MSFIGAALQQHVFVRESVFPCISRQIPRHSFTSEDPCTEHRRLLQLPNYHLKCGQSDDATPLFEIKATQRFENKQVVRVCLARRIVNVKEVWTSYVVFSSQTVYIAKLKLKCNKACDFSPLFKNTLCLSNNAQIFIPYSGLRPFISCLPAGVCSFFC